MKKWNKKIKNKLQELMIRAYPVTVKNKTAPQKVSKIKKELY